MLGILPVNAAFFAYPVESALNPGLPPQALTSETAWTWLLMHVGFELKMVTLFSMLFGVSLHLVGGERADRDKAKVLHRRLGWLAVFGLAHGALIWFGDILLTYAACGLVAMLWRSASPRSLVVVGIALYGFAWLLQTFIAFGITTMPAAALAELSASIWDPGAAVLDRTVLAMRGDFASSLSENMREWADYIGYAVFYAPRTIALMLLGLGLFKLGFFHGRWPMWRYMAGLGAGAIAGGIVGAVTVDKMSDGLTFIEMFGPSSLWNAGLSVVIALGYASALIAVVKAGALNWLSSALGDVGRMGFTNYITQSLIMTAIFWGGRGPGLFGDIDRVGLWGIVAAIWLLQIIISRLWLSVFALGPLEWLWRLLSHGRLIRLRKAT